MPSEATTMKSPIADVALIYRALTSTYEGIVLAEDADALSRSAWELLVNGGASATAVIFSEEHSPRCLTIASLLANHPATLVAKAVETVEQHTFLRDYSCDQMQGFFFSKAVPADELAALLRQNLR